MWNRDVKPGSFVPVVTCAEVNTLAVLLKWTLSPEATVTDAAAGSG